MTLTTRPADLHGLPPCGGFNGRKADINGLKVTTAALANQLEFILRSMVSDETGLAGHDYDMHLHWTPDDLGAGAPEPGNADASGPSIFTALQEQLGLKLESRKGPVDVIVIDRAEKASPN